MRNREWQSIALVFALALTATLPAVTTSAFGAASAQANLLANGSMEDGFSDRFGDGNGMTPNGWNPWYIDSPDGCNNFRPVYSQAVEAYDGGAAALIFLNYQSYTAGLMQDVSVPAGSAVRFTAFGRIISSEAGVGATSSSPGAGVEMKVGIDPTGAGNPFSPGIVWSGSINAVGGYQQFSVEAAAQGDRVSVFLYSRPQWCFAENSTFWDAASLVVSGEGGGGAAAPQPPPQNVSIEVAPPRADGSIVHVVQPGQYLYLIAGSYGVTVQQIKDLNGLTSSILHTGDELLIRPAEGAEEEPEEPTSTPPPTTPPQQVTAIAVGPEAAITGNLCVLAFKDGNRSASRDPGEDLLAGATITLSDGERELGRYTTIGISPSEPYCFSNLDAGTYDLLISGADLVSTTPSNIRLAVPAGQTIRVEYGAVPSQAEPPVQPPDPGPALDLGFDLTAGSTATRLVIAAVGAAGVILFMTVLGVVVYLGVLRPRVR
jgi:LysM repeat protein